MYESDLQEKRLENRRMRESESSVRTLDQAREFVHAVGFCLKHPQHPPLLVPDFLSAYLGLHGAEAKTLAKDPRAEEALELVERLLREREAFTVPFTGDNQLLISPAEFPYFYALMGERSPRLAESEGARGEHRMMSKAFEAIQQSGPASKDFILARIGKGVTGLALDRVLNDLKKKLRIVEVRRAEGDTVYDDLLRWAPELVNRGRQISSAEALSALVSRYLETNVAVEQKDIEDFFAHLAPRSKVNELLKAMQAVREFTQVQVGGKNMLRLTSREPEPEVTALPEGERPMRPWQKRDLARKEEEMKAKKFGKRAPREGAEEERPRKSFAPSGERKSFAPRGEGKSFAPRGDRPFKPRGDRPFTPREGGERKPFTPRGEGKTFAPRGDRPFKPRGDRPFTPREGGERKPFTPRGEGKSFAPRGDRPFKPRGDRPFTPREGGERKPYAARGEGKSFAPRGRAGFKPRDERGERKPFNPSEGRGYGGGEGRPFTPRDGERKPYAPRGDRKDFKPRGDRPFKSGDRKDFAPRSPRGEGKSFASRGDRPFKPRGDRPFTPREGGEGRPYKERGEGKTFAPRGERKPFTPRAEGEAGERKPYAPRSGGKSFGPKREFRPSGGKPAGKFGGARSGGRPSGPPRGKPSSGRGPRKDGGRS